MPPRRPSSKYGSSSRRMSTGSRRASRSTSSSSSSSSRKSQRSLPGSTAEPPVVEKSAADAATTVDAATSEPAPRPDAAPARAAASESAAPLARRRSSTRSLSMMTEPTHRFAFDGTRPTREETKTSELKTRTEVKRTIGERLTATSSRSQRSQVRFVLKVALVAGLLTTVIVVLVLLTLSRLYWSGSETATSYPLAVCRTADCHAHAKALSSSIASAHDPCQDFSLFVCMAWNRTHVPFATSLTEQLVVDSLLALTQLTAGSGGGVTLEDRPARFMELCKTARPEQDAQGLQALKEFLRRDELNFIWRSRQQTITYAQLLEALAVFSGKWLVPMWFRLDLIARGPNSSLLVIEPEPMVTLWYKLHAKLLKSYYFYLKKFAIVIYEEDPESPLLTNDYVDFLWDLSPAVQTDVFRALSVAASTRLPIPVEAKLSELPDFASNFTSAAWAVAVFKAFGKNIEEHDAVYVSSRQLLDAMNYLSDFMSADRLLYHAVWWFVQQIGTLTSNVLFDITLASIGESGTGLLCGMQGIVAYNVLLASRHAATVQAAARQSVEDTLNMVQSVAVTTVSASKHLGQRAQNSTYSMLLESHPAVWPIPPNFDPMDFQSLYGELVDGSLGFFGHWLSTREGLQRSFGRNVHSAAAQFYRLDPSSLTAYSAPHKSVSVSTTALQSPLYYGAGTAAMRYGGLGFAYATQLVRNMDVRALLDAAAAGKSLVAEEKDHLLESFDCSDEDEKQRAFPHLPAMVLAHAAYSQSTNGTTQDPRLPGMEQYTGLQVFFMTACLSLCELDTSGRQWSSECNVAARNYAPFAEAFRCSTDTPMNPKEKCGLLKN